MEHVYRLHHRSVAAARRNAPSPPPALHNDILARDGPDDGSPFMTDLFPPPGQVPSPLITIFPPILPTSDTLSEPPFTITDTDTPVPSKPSKPTANSSSSTDTTSPAETPMVSPVSNTSFPVLNTPSSPVSLGTDPITSTSGYPLSSKVPAVVTQVVSPLSSNNTSASQTSGATNSGPVAAGVVIGLVGASAIVVFLVFLVRRKRRKAFDDFDATEFRRSAVLMPDTPSHEDVVARGFKPRPPTMIERKMANSPAIPAATYGNMYNGSYNQTMSAGGQPGNPSGSSHTQELFTSERLMNPFSVPPSPGSVATAGHTQSPGSVLVTPKAPYIIDPSQGPRRTSRPAIGNDPGAANGFTFPRRQGSGPSTVEHQKEQNVAPEQVPSDDYVVLCRSTLFPPQAAQREFISRNFNPDVPHSLNDIDETSIMAPSSLEYIDEPPPVPPKSPFESPEHATVEPSIESAGDVPPPVPSKSPFEDPEPENKSENIRDSVCESFVSHQALRAETPELLDFPIPPSPALTLTSRHRVDSLPHSLPELKLDSGLGIRPLNVIKVKPKNPSSPLAANNITSGDEVEETRVSPVQSSAGAPSNSRPETVYDAEDAYGGI